MRNMKHVLAAAAAMVVAGIALPTSAGAEQLVTNGSFSAGDTGFSSDATRVTGAPGSQAGVHPSYDVTTSPNLAANAYSDWDAYGDHTSGSGLMMVVNAGAGDVWRQAIALTAGESYTFSVWGRHALTGTNGLGALPVLQFFVDGVAIGDALTIQGPASAGWQNLTFDYTALAASQTISIRDLTTDANYNDFSLDDVSIIGPDAIPGVPEPASWAMMIGGFGAVGGTLRRRKVNATLRIA